jgi:hypothetical protein
MSNKSVRAVSAWEGPILRAAILASFRKLDPRLMMRNPVMFVVEVGSVLTTVVAARFAVVSSGHSLVVHGAGGAVALVHGPVRELRGSAGRGPGGPGGGPRLRQETLARKPWLGARERSGVRLRKGDDVTGSRARPSPATAR